VLEPWVVPTCFLFLSVPFVCCLSCCPFGGLTSGMLCVRLARLARQQSPLSFYIRVASEDAVKPQLWELIERAAELVGENRSDFILDAPVVPRPDILLDRSTVAVSPKANRGFVARLDAAPQPNKRLDINSQERKLKCPNQPDRLRTEQKIRRICLPCEIAA